MAEWRVSELVPDWSLERHSANWIRASRETH